MAIMITKIYGLVNILDINCIGFYLIERLVLHLIKILKFQFNDYNLLYAFSLN